MYGRVWVSLSLMSPSFTLSQPKQDIGLHCPGNREAIVKMQASFHWLIDHLYIFYGEMSVEGFALFLIGLFQVLLLLSSPCILFEITPIKGEKCCIDVRYYTLHHYLNLLKTLKYIGVLWNTPGNICSHWLPQIQP